MRTDAGNILRQKFERGGYALEVNVNLGNTWIGGALMKKFFSTQCILGADSWTEKGYTDYYMNSAEHALLVRRKGTFFLTIERYAGNDKVVKIRSCLCKSYVDVDTEEVEKFEMELTMALIRVMNHTETQIVPVDYPKSELPFVLEEPTRVAYMSLDPAKNVQPALAWTYLNDDIRQELGESARQVSHELVADLNYDGRDEKELLDDDVIRECAAEYCQKLNTAGTFPDFFATAVLVARMVRGVGWDNRVGYVAAILETMICSAGATVAIVTTDSTVVTVSSVLNLYGAKNRSRDFYVSQDVPLLPWVYYDGDNGADSHIYKFVVNPIDMQTWAKIASVDFCAIKNDSLMDFILLGEGDSVLPSDARDVMLGHLTERGLLPGVALEASPTGTLHDIPSDKECHVSRGGPLWDRITVVRSGMALFIYVLAWCLSWSNLEMDGLAAWAVGFSGELREEMQPRALVRFVMTKRAGGKWTHIKPIDDMLLHDLLLTVVACAPVMDRLWGIFAARFVCAVIWVFFAVPVILTITTKAAMVSSKRWASGMRDGYSHEVIKWLTGGNDALELPDGRLVTPFLALDGDPSYGRRCMDRDVTHLSWLARGSLFDGHSSGGGLWHGASHKGSTWKWRACG